YMDQPGTPDEQSDTDNATDEGSQRAVPRLVIVPIAMVVIGLLVGLPLLRVLVLEQDDEVTQRNAANAARERVAVLFSSAVLEQRSNQAAERYMVEGVREQVSAIIADLRRRDSALLQDAV